jgi:hypothetical protein
LPMAPPSPCLASPPGIIGSWAQVRVNRPSFPPPAMAAMAQSFGSPPMALFQSPFSLPVSHSVVTRTRIILWWSWFDRFWLSLAGPPLHRRHACCPRRHARGRSHSGSPLSRLSRASASPRPSATLAHLASPRHGRKRAGTPPSSGHHAPWPPSPYSEPR